MQYKNYNHGVRNWGSVQKILQKRHHTNKFNHLTAPRYVAMACRLWSTNAPAGELELVTASRYILRAPSSRPKRQGSIYPEDKLLRTELTRGIVESVRRDGEEGNHDVLAMDR
jgi:hypothetical protein